MCRPLRAGRPVLHQIGLIDLWNVQSHRRRDRLHMVVHLHFYYPLYGRDLLLAIKVRAREVRKGHDLPAQKRRNPEALLVRTETEARHRRDHRIEAS